MLLIFQVEYYRNPQSIDTRNPDSKQKIYSDKFDDTSRTVSKEKTSSNVE